ncbi:hypothetical protein GDO78_014553 [Eleutherodactylus coqui]|uniref:Ig-like domain-containing protein n=1 Tax=Eleutherodactylus coqui TaxID=57060 RepID=A0A8J6EMA1_ELECQ|nr:hypothetical protein GDO78_014553 [Eleutherodactylus coqui]
MSCSHNDQTYLIMLWYQQKKGRGMKLIAYSSGKDDSNIEDNAKKWVLQRPDILKSSLTITKAAVQDSAVYFCASRAQLHTTGGKSTKNLDFRENLQFPPTGGALSFY